MKLLSRVRLFASPWTTVLPGSSIHGIFPGKSPGVGCHFLLQEIFPIQGSNLHFLHCRWMICSLSHQGRFNLKVQVAQSCPALCNPMDYAVHGVLQARILVWAAFSFSRASSQPRDWTQVSCIASGFFTSWATREALNVKNRSKYKKARWP